MARGWESKSIEAQQEDAAQTSSCDPPLSKEEAYHLREVCSLRLSLKRVTEQIALSPNPRHRAMLELARSDLQRRIEGIESKGSIHHTGSP